MHHLVSCPAFTARQQVDGNSTVARALFSRLPFYPATQSRRPTDLSSSRATLLNACPALLPRWNRRHLVRRARDCCLPTRQRRRHLLASVRSLFHDYNHFGADKRSLHPRFTRLRTPPLDDAREFRYRPADQALTGQDLGVTLPHLLGSKNQFPGSQHLLSSISKVSDLT